METPAHPRCACEEKPSLEPSTKASPVKSSGVPSLDHSCDASSQGLKSQPAAGSGARPRA
eukprot:9028838-Lingulodinium_polyedra.AAC.1